MIDSFYFKINTKAIAHETIDGEVVMVNLNNGSYYSIDKAGALIWNYIVQGITVKKIIELIKNQYSGENADIERGINGLFADLLKEELILLSDAETGDSANSISINNSLENEKAVFEKPILQKFTDMQDLLLLDPIHDVDEMGWPDPKKSSKDK